MNTPSEEWELLDKIAGSVQAEILKGLLEAQGIEVQTFQEAAGKSLYPGTFGFLSEVEFFVKASDLVRARELLDEFEAQIAAEGDDSSPEASSDPT